MRKWYIRLLLFGVPTDAVVLVAKNRSEAVVDAKSWLLAVGRHGGWTVEE